MADDYRLWSVPKLKLELISRSAVTTGRKIDLINRLESYDRNDNFRGPVIILPDMVNAEWPITGYQQLTNEHKEHLPAINFHQIEGYLLYRMAEDKQISGDVKALQKGKDMVDGGRVLACSVLLTANGTFFSGIVGAAMKNKVTYNYKVKINPTGDPDISNCECPAGKGPHGTCKHIAAVLLLLQWFTETGEIKVKKTCTENIQKFHKPKTMYEGKPVFSEKIPMKRKIIDEMMDDPRPEKRRNNVGFTDSVRNRMVNYVHQSSQDLAMRYLFPTANIQIASEDHKYLPLPLTEYLVDRALQVTDQGIEEIERDTRKQSNCKLWYDERRWRVTASRFGDVTKMTCRRNIKKLCASMFSFHKINTMPIIHGRQHEKDAVIHFESLTGLKVTPAGLFISLDYPFLGASPDGIIDEHTILEIKCPFKGRNNEIQPGTNFPFLCYDSRNEIVLKCYSKYYDQVQGQLLITKRKLCYFMVYTLCDTFIQKIYMDNNYCNFSMLPKLQLFFTKYYRPFVASQI